MVFPLAVHILAAPGPQRVLNVLVAQQGGHVEPRHVGAQEPARLLQVALLEFAQAGDARLGRDAVVRRHPRDGRVARDGREAELDEFRRVQVPVVVLAARDGRREEDAGGVDRLKDAAEVSPPRDFLDQDRGEALRAQLLVHDQEVDLGAALRAVTPAGWVSKKWVRR